MYLSSTEISDDSITVTTRVQLALPNFTAATIGDAKLLVDRSEFQSRSSVILFLSEGDIHAIGKELFPSIANGLMNEIDGNLYVAWQGPCDLALEFSKQLGRYASLKRRVVLLNDSHATLARKFEIIRTPSSILIDEDGVIRKTGAMLSNADDLDQDAFATG